MMLGHPVRWAAEKWLLGWEEAHFFRCNSGEQKKASARGGSLAVWERTRVFGYISSIICEGRTSAVRVEVEV